MNKKSLQKSLDFIDSWLKLRLKDSDTPGYSVAIFYENKPIFTKSYGLANIKNEEKLTNEHVFRIASHSKTFTATAIMQLQEKNKLRIDDHLADYIPWLNEHTDKRWQKVTIRQVLSHSAGIIRDGHNADYWSLKGSFPDTAQLKKDILASKLIIENNIKLKYSNYGYSLLGLVVEKASGTPYNQYITDNIIMPLELKNTGPDYNDSTTNSSATGYFKINDDKFIPIDTITTNAMSPATGVYSTAEDLGKYFSAQVVGSGLLLDDESKKEMQRAQFQVRDPHAYEKRAYGLGMALETIDGVEFLGHAGGMPGFITTSLFNPKNKLVISVLTNSISGPSRMIFGGINRIINYYQQNMNSDSNENYQALEGRYSSIWGTTTILDMGDKMVATYADSWWVLSGAEELEPINKKTTFKLANPGSYSSEGEEVRFNLTNDKVDSVTYAGATLIPEEKWLKEMNSIELLSVTPEA